jgi:hypothetical protein
MPTALQLIHKYYPEVKTIVDAKRVVRVDVSPEDCTKGNKKAPNTCAMARAFEREKNYDGAIISMSVSYLIRGEKATRFMTPEAVSREIVSFDRNADFAPGRYSLNPPSEKETLVGKRSYASNQPDKKYAQKKKSHAR